MKIGIFGGSFNPPHQMHLNIALELIFHNFVDKVIYVPTGDKYLKQNLVTAKNRYQMLNIMTEKYPCLEVSNYEMKNSLVYTYQTLDHFQELYPNDQLYFICGTDNLKELNNWKNYPHILKKYHIIAIRRNDDNIEELLEKYNIYKSNIIIPNIKTDYLSSTAIRNDLKNQNKKIVKKIDKKVVQYIEKHNLYN